ncbi:c-type cytochrome [Devosia faecipullorum]|uniref:c-type cytochrome n=1 Tax=Devosia faecipullorum TaxID=2755039 RepID=UPI00187B8562|nr:cytochrome c family protein [Devosia faecipullorum]MBE7734197.1 c-type cytochrome [Devosia faecipullorum]
MDSFELNKILGAVLGTLLFVMGIGFLAEAIYSPIEGRGPGYALPEPEAVASAGPVEEVPSVPLAALLASASADRGASAVRKCQSCHNFGEGEPNKQGPNLYNIVDASKAHADGFAYSDILLQQKSEGQVWSYDNLNAFLENPRGYAPGTKMAFAGVKSPEERADILAYLQTLSGSPVPFPTAEAPAADDAATEEEAPASDAVPAEVTAPADASAPVTAPAAVTETPATTEGETAVEGTPAEGGATDQTTAPAVGQ